MLRRSALREIKSSLGRYLAIIAIIALGVGFFAGLRSSRPAMVGAAQRYLAETEFYDFRVVNTLGSDGESVEALAAAPGVALAVGSVSTDVLCAFPSGDTALRAMSITEGVNLPTLKAGRMPESADECLADSEHFTEADIGTKIVISEANDSDTLDMFAYREYTITGLAMSPLYMNYERGGTSLGSGQLAGFFMVPESGFSTDYYTEIYLRLENEQSAYTDEYDSAVSAVKDRLTSLAEAESAARYERVVADAEAEIADGEAELADGWEEYRTERADAEAELADAYQELLDARAELSDGWAEYYDGLETYEREIADAEAEIADGEAELTDAYEELLEGEEDYASGLLAMEVGDSQLQSGIAEYTTGLIEYEDGLKQYEEGAAELEKARRELSFAESQLKSASAELQSGRQQMNTLLATLAGQLGTDADGLLAALRAGDENTKMAVDMALGAMAGMGMEGVPANSDALIASCDALDAAEQQLSDGWSEYRAGEREYLDGKAELEASKAALDTAKARLDKAKETIDESYAEYSDGLAELYDARYDLQTGWAEYHDGVQELHDARETLETERADGKRELQEAYEELLDGEDDYSEGYQDYLDGVAEAEQEFADAEAELADAERDLADAKRELSELEPPNTYVLGRDTNVGYLCFENDSAIVEGISGVFPIFFFLVAALVCMTTMARMVEEQRTQIGVLKALGYAPREIAAKYLFYSGSAALIGSALGVVGGPAVFPRVIWQAYGIMYGFGGLETSLSPLLSLGCIAVSLAGALGVSWLTCRAELREVPAELIRPKAPAAGKRVLLEKLPFIWNRLKFLHKVSIRNLTRYKKRFFMMVLGIGGCTALLLTGYGIDDSIGGLTDFQYGEVTMYDFSVSFSDALSPESEAQFLAGTDGLISGALFVHESSIDLEGGSGVKSVNLVVSPEEVEGFVQLRSNGERVELPGEGEAVINNGLAKALGLSIGDGVTLRDGDMNELHLTVSGIFDNFVYNYVYVSPESYESAFGDCEYKSAWVLSAGEDAHATAAEILRLDSVAAIDLSTDMRERVDSMMESMKYIVVMVIVCAGALAFIVLYNLTNINITEREREIATLKVLGFFPNETAAYVFRENIMLTAIGALIGLALGRALHAFVMSQIVVDMVCFDVRVYPSSYLASVLWTFGFSLCVSLIMRRRLDSINMAESLKSIE